MRFPLFAVFVCKLWKIPVIHRLKMVFLLHQSILMI